jgi:hypothetical protein
MDIVENFRKASLIDFRWGGARLGRVIKGRFDGGLICLLTWTSTLFWEMFAISHWLIRMMEPTRLCPQTVG